MLSPWHLNRSLISSTTRLTRGAILVLASLLVACSKEATVPPSVGTPSADRAAVPTTLVLYPTSVMAEQTMLPGEVQVTSIPATVADSSPAALSTVRVTTLPPGDSVAATAPKQLLKPKGIKFISSASGASHTCAVKDDGVVVCWGLSYAGQLGNGSPMPSPAPVVVAGLNADVKSVALGQEYSCALLQAGNVQCWGGNMLGQLGNGSNQHSLTPVDVVGLDRDIIAITSGSGHACALASDGGVRCWGHNGVGKLGDGSFSSRSVAADVVGLASGVTTIAAGSDHTCAITTHGGVKCWGSNVNSQLGDGTTTAAQTTPVDAVGLNSGISAVAAGGTHTCALTSEGSVKCWGGTGQGQTGDGVSAGERAMTPVDVVGLGSGVIAIAAGSAHTCALTNLGGVKCWGLNDHGQLGNGTTTPIWQPSPVDVVGLESRAFAITAGAKHTCALLSEGGVKCWGFNSEGELGDGTKSDSSTPVSVIGF